MFAETRPHTALDSVAAVSSRDPNAAGSVESDARQPITVVGAVPDPTEELQRKIYDLVKTRVLQSIGAGANWTITFRTSADTDTFFSDTMADMIAWDVAHQLMAPTVPNRARLAS